MMIRLATRYYCRPFTRPLQTAHGLWTQREGLILRFQTEAGQVGFGEIAPIPWFGTETLAQAQQLCDRWPKELSLATFLSELASIPATWPASQFGFGAGINSFRNQPSDRAEIDQSIERLSAADICALLPTGPQALEHWERLWQQGHRTFKWKIGVTDAAAELDIFQSLCVALPTTATLRLDANGGLTAATATTWLQTCDRAPIHVEFIEQPLAPDQVLSWLGKIGDQFHTAIALDESVASFPQLQAIHQQWGNRVVYVIKPAIAGRPQPLLAYCQHHQLDVVFSSALETPIGRHSVFQMAKTLWQGGLSRRALGFGIDHFFADDWQQLEGATLWEQL